jgi:hypothetical protein
MKFTEIQKWLNTINKALTDDTIILICILAVIIGVTL